MLNPQLYNNQFVSPEISFRHAYYPILNLGPDNKKIGKNLDQYSGMTHLHNKRNK